MLFKMVRAQLIVVSSNAVATVYAFFSSDGRNAVLFVCVALFFEEKKKEVALSHFSGVYYSSLSLARSHAIVHNEWSLYGYIKVCALQIQEYIYNYVCVYLFYSTKQPLPFLSLSQKQ